DAAHAAADGERHETGFRGALHDIENDAAVLVAGGDVKEAQFVGAGGVIGDRRFHRVAGVAQVDEIDALDHAAVFDVETGNDAAFEHRLCPHLGRADERQRRRRIQPPVVERAAGDGAFEFLGARIEQRFDVVERSKPAGGDHRNRYRLRERDGGVEIETLQHAVAGNVRIDDGGDAGVLEAPRDVERRNFRALRPALDRHCAIARVQSHGHAAGIIARGLLDEGRIAHRGSADDDAGDALFEPGFDCRGVAYAAAKLDRNADRFEDALDGARIHRLAGESAVEIDKVQIFKALLLEQARLLGGIAVEDRGARHVALLQADAGAVLQIDGGKEDHGFHFRKLAIKARPRRWLFSGWNCVPTIFSRPTAAAMGPPYSVSASRSPRFAAFSP